MQDGMPDGNPQIDMPVHRSHRPDSREDRQQALVPGDKTLGCFGSVSRHELRCPRTQAV